MDPETHNLHVRLLLLLQRVLTSNPALQVGVHAVQTVRPEDAAYLPSWQPTQEVDPEMLEKVPAGQLVHTLDPEVLA